MPRSAHPRPFRPTVTRYHDPHGRRCSSTHPKARKTTETTLTWYADLPGEGRVSLGTTDEHEAWERLRQKLREAHERRLGIRHEYMDLASQPIDVHFLVWASILEAKGGTRKHVDTALGRLQRLAQLAGWKTLPDITHDSALQALARMQAPVRQGGLGAAAKTRNHYLGHLKAFVSWAHDSGRMAQNPVRRIAPINEETDRRRVRRVATAEEIGELCRWLQGRTAPERRGLSGRERRLGYLVSMTTGLRADELRSLTVEAFDLREGTATVAAAYSKRRRTDTQRLPAWLVAELRAWFARGEGWNWHDVIQHAPGIMLKQDLAGTRQTWIDAAPSAKERRQRAATDFLRYRTETPQGPRYLDYHSLRHGYVTHLASMPGMDLKTLLTLSRLSSAELALHTYSHSQEDRLRAAVEQIPPPEAP